MGVARPRDPSPRQRLPARVLRGREPAPRRERRAPLAEPRGVARLAGEQERGGDVDALHAPQRVDGSASTPGGPPTPRPSLASVVARLLAAPHAVAVVLVGGRVVGLGELDRVGPPPVGARPAAPCLRAGRRRLVEDVPVAQQELRHPLLGPLQVVAGVGEGAGEVPGGLGAPVGDPYLDDVAGGEQAREELGVAAVGLAPPVGGGPLHLGDGPHAAVDAESPQGAAEVEAGDAGLVDRPGGLEAERPPCDRCGVAAERGALDLPGHRVQGAGLYAAGVDVEADGCDIIGHGALPLRMWRAATVGGTTIVARPTELRQGEGPMFSSYRLFWHFYL